MTWPVAASLGSATSLDIAGESSSGCGASGFGVEVASVIEAAVNSVSAIGGEATDSCGSAVLAGLSCDSFVMT
jgi:hypothetical protein